MKHIKLFLVFLSITILQSCSKDDPSNDGPEVPSDPFATVTLNTTQPIFDFNSNQLTLGGTLSNNLGGNYEYSVGVCYNNSPNPTIFNNISSASGYTGNSFVSYAYSNFNIGTTYYFRAYIQKNSTGEVKYGNEISFIQNIDLTTSIVKNISLNGFSVDVNVGANLSANYERGICYSTSQNPTVSNQKIQDPTNGSGIFNITVNGITGSPFYYVNKNTTYYLRSYVNMGGQYYYGNQVSFKTCGYIGGSGGYVFYDKGENTNGWRYLEAAVNKLNDPNSTNFKWSNSSTFMSNISLEIGTGLENSILIKNSNNYTNIAAAMCVYVSNNNVNDWFLPSINELKELYKLKQAGLIFNPSSGTNSYYNKNVLSSSQRDANQCYGINFDNGQEVILGKNEQLYSAWQVRRF